MKVFTLLFLALVLSGPLYAQNVTTTDGETVTFRVQQPDKVVKVNMNELLRRQQILTKQLNDVTTQIKNAQDAINEFKGI